ncbi:hypothetical protein PLANTIT3_80040 [Plantibacter sp. T3]|nr:hypothetical protein PLANTIT3_80040 [Plantibacter sp. T3]
MRRPGWATTPAQHRTTPTHRSTRHDPNHQTASTTRRRSTRRREHRADRLLGGVGLVRRGRWQPHLPRRGDPHLGAGAGGGHVADPCAPAEHHRPTALPQRGDGRTRTVDRRLLDRQPRRSHVYLRDP